MLYVIDYMKNLPFLIIILLTLGCSSEPIRIGTELNSLPTPAISELGNNQSFHEQQIELTGYYFSGFEMSGLFERKRIKYDEAVWVDVSRELWEHFYDSLANELAGRKLRVQGTFNANSQGHLGQYVGTIKLQFLSTLD